MLKRGKYILRVDDGWRREEEKVCGRERRSVGWSKGGWERGRVGERE